MIFIYTECKQSVDSLNSWQYPDCDNLKEGIIRLDSDIVQKEINKLLSDFKPQSTKDDPIGHEKNINILIDRLNNNCDNCNAELFCYACIKTLPPQTEIVLEVDSSGTSINRIIDILTPADNKLQCLRVHKF